MLAYLGTTVHILCFVAVALIAYDIIKRYKAATGTTWQRLVAAFKGSATILWARAVALFSGGADVATSIGDFVNAPSVSSAVQTFLKPEYVPFYLLVVAVVAELARRRTLKASS